MQNLLILAGLSVAAVAGGAKLRTTLRFESKLKLIRPQPPRRFASRPQLDGIISEDFSASVHPASPTQSDRHCHENPLVNQSVLAP
jgi:hypothetical protein